MNPWQWFSFETGDVIEFLTCQQIAVDLIYQHDAIIYHNTC